MILAENRPEWMMIDFSIVGIGAVDVPLYPSLTPKDIGFIINNSESLKLLWFQTNFSFLNF